jgi:hypothetical protein
LGKPFSGTAIAYYSNEGVRVLADKIAALIACLEHCQPNLQGGGR